MRYTEVKAHKRKIGRKNVRVRKHNRNYSSSPKKKKNKLPKMIWNPYTQEYEFEDEVKDYSSFPKIRPKGIGTKWKGSKYIHGPRRKSPKSFSKFRLGKVRKGGKRFVFGKLKKSGKWEIQSELIPIKKNYGSGPKTEEEYKAQKLKMKEKYGLEFPYESLAEKRKAIREMNKLAKEMGYPRGIKQYMEEEDEN